MLQPLSDIRSWCDKATELERYVGELSKMAKEGDSPLRALRQELLEERAGIDRAAMQLRAVQRARRLTREELAQTGAALRQELPDHETARRDNRGLRRTLEHLQHQLSCEEGEVARGCEASAEMESAEGSSEGEARALQQALEAAREARRGQAALLAAQRDRRLELDAAVRAKLERVDRDLEPLRRQLHEAETTTGLWEERAAEQRSRARAAEDELSKQRGALQSARAAAQQRQDDGQALRRELVEVNDVHDQLHAELKAVLDQLAERAHRDRDSKQEWRLRHLEKVDARALREELRDSGDVVVAEADHAEEELNFTSTLIPAS